MFSKLFDQKTKTASDLLAKLNISHKRVHVLTQFKDIEGLFNSSMIKIPQMKYFFKAMKRQSFSVDYAIKCGVLTHFFIQNGQKDQFASLRDFTTHLICRVKEIGQSIGCFFGSEVLKTEVLKTDIISMPTQSDEVNYGKEKFILMQIVRPYLSYLSKTTIIKEQAIAQEQLQNHQIWRLVNLLKMISAITSKFMVIGRYYFQDYAAIVILLSEVLSIDICEYVEQINEYLRRQSRVLSLSSDRAEDKREVQEFLRLLQEMGWLHQKLSQFFLGKYFYQFLRHIRQPEWLDSNSEQFDSLFSFKR